MAARLDAVDAFAGVDLFAGLRRRHLLELAKAAREIAHPPGHEVVTEGKVGLGFHVIAAGTAEVFVGRSSRGVLRAGDYFGEISVIDGKPRSATVVAGPDGVTTYHLNRARFLAIVDSDRNVARAVMVNLCTRIRASASTL
jgi:CRP/FNR family transcriptional regulator, cyclic AMP receptor protein